ncbi:MAG TPA: hypothetical protein VH560_16670 [Polyangia bacterium]|nr:hypothetical protein [Polyangia bacterium]
MPRGLLVLVGAGAIGAACSSPSEPHGSPILTRVYWSAAGTQQVVWSQPGDPVPMPTSVSPFADEIDFVFDRRLDGSRIEDIITEGGVLVPVPKTPAAIGATWPDVKARMSTPPFDLVVDYNSVPLFGDQSAYVLARPQVPGFPSGDTITFNLLLSSLTSAYGDIANAPKQITVKTQPFGVSIAAPTFAVATNYQLPLAFSNRLPPVAASGAIPAIAVTVAGAAVPYKLLADASLLSRWYVAPADCLAAWPANSTLTVTIEAGLPDAFGAPLAASATATFATLARSGATPDASCAVADAGAADGGVTDAASDAVVDAGAPEAGPTDLDASTADGGVDAAPDAPSDSASDAASDAASDTPATFDAAVESSSGAG